MDNMIKQLGIGREGRCYLLKDGSVIKALYDDYYRNFALQFKDLDIPSFIFAQNAAFVGDYVRAVFMKYADGYDLSQKMPMDQDFLLLGEQLNKVVQDLNILSNKGILVRDFYCGNIIYNGKEFRIIDTLPYLFLKGNDYHDQNLYEVMNKIYAKLLGEILKRIDRSHLGNSNGSLHYLGNKERLENPSEYFSLLKRFIKDTTSHDIKTLGDAHGVLQKKYPN